MKKIGAVVFAVLIVFSVFATWSVGASSSSHCEDKDDYCKVSLVQLLAAPNQYEGQKVVVFGYFVGRMETSGIFLTEEYAERGVFSSAVAVNSNSMDDDTRAQSDLLSELEGRLIDSDQASGQYVFAIGTFHAGRAGHFGAFPGELKDSPGFVPTVRD